jgi:hypothetical protein
VSSWTSSGAVRRACVLLLASTAASGCASSGVRSFSFPDPPATASTVPAPAVTLPAGLALLGETPVEGVTATTAPVVGPGSASLTGTVMGPSGPVAGATVEADRFVGTQFASARTTSAADGTWSLRSILGGDYRVRAWLAPTLDMATPQLLFLAAGQPQSVTLQLTSYQGQQVQVAIDPADPVVGQPANLVVQVTKPGVSSEGVLTTPPVSGAPVTLVDGAGWQVTNGNPIVTDASGEASFDLECTTPGADPLGAQIGGQPPVSLQMPDCGAAPTTTTTAIPAPSTTTTTTCPATPGTTSESGTTTTTLTFGQC